MKPRPPLLLRIARSLFHAVVPSMRSIRLAAYSTVVFGLLALASGSSVYADMREVGLGVGEELAKLEDLTHGAYHVRLNGAELRWSNARTPQTVDQVLDRFERYCREAPSALGQAMLDVPATLEDRVPIPKADPARAGVVRQGRGDRGMVACFVADPGARGGAAGVTERLEAFGRSGDLSNLGRFRYVFAERGKAGPGGLGLTRVVTLWSDGPLRIGEMFPATGDAPGTDSAVAPRPADSRRTLCASVDGFPASIRIYETPRTPAEVLEALDPALRASGFARAPGIDASKGAAAWVRSDGAEIIVSLSRTSASGVTPRTSVTFLESNASPSGVLVRE